MGYTKYPKLFAGMVILLILVVIFAGWKEMTGSTHLPTTDTNVQDIVCMDTIIYEGSYDGVEQHCQTFVNLNPVCIEAFGKSQSELEFSSELECRAYVKQQTNCEKNDDLLKLMGIKCP